MIESLAINPEAVAIYHRGVELHRKRCLSDAMRLYREALQLNPASEPTAQQAALMLRHAPRLFTTPDEPLPLKDVAAILHPELPIIGYHLFWEDDIDFPSNSDPCDHEVAWVRLDEQRQRVVGVYANYYHSLVIPSAAAVEEAAQHSGRPRIDVQWGKHGLLPFGWEGIGDERLVEDMRSTYQRLHTTGCRRADHPLARRWPHRFKGGWEDFIRFTSEVDARVWLRWNQMMMVGHFANAIIDWFFLRYNFFPKFSWPDLDNPSGGIL
jgi:hypothetical protein